MCVCVCCVLRKGQTQSRPHNRHTASPHTHISVTHSSRLRYASPCRCCPTTTSTKQLGFATTACANLTARRQYHLLQHPCPSRCRLVRPKTGALRQPSQATPPAFVAWHLGACQKPLPLPTGDSSTMMASKRHSFDHQRQRVMHNKGHGPQTNQTGTHKRQCSPLPRTPQTSCVCAGPSSPRS